MNGITIEVVALNGKMVGRRAQDRFNLRALGLTDLVDDGRSQASLKRARRNLAKLYGNDFTLVKARSKAISIPTVVEVEALGAALALAA